MDMDKGAILDELIALATTTEVEPDEWTVGDYAERANCAYSRAQREMEALLAQGIVTRRRALSGGRRVWAYRRANRDGAV